MSVKLITFKTNQTILGDVDYVGGEYTVKQPVQVILQPTKDGPMMGFSPFLDFCEEFKTGIKFSASDILTVTTPITELTNQYSQVFGAGIEIVSSIHKS
jgi:hypothetical protein